MKPLLEITTVPISIEIKTNAGHFEPKEGTAELKISREKGGIHIESQPVQVNIDSYETNRSFMDQGITNNSASYGQRVKSGGFSATARYSNNGNILLNAKLSEEASDEIGKIRLTSNERPPEHIKWVPEKKPKVKVPRAEMNIKYEMDKVKTEFEKNKEVMEFVPGSIELTVTQNPEMTIEYVGGPIYVPPSSDPNYEGEEE